MGHLSPGSGPDVLARLWTDPNNWQTLGLYRAAEDPRLIVPKRKGGIGWTLNVAHPASWLVLLAAMLLLGGGTRLLLSSGVRPALVFLAVAVFIGALSAGCHWESTRPRNESPPV